MDDSTRLDPRLDPGVRLEGGYADLEGEDILGDRYEVLRELGEGGMGRVLLVRDRQLRREVALKMMRPGHVTDQGIVRFLTEAQATAQLAHPNIVPIYDSGVLPGGDLYVTMKLVEGRTLEAVLAEHRRRPTVASRNRILRRLIDVTQGLAYAHSRGVIHRDLKPANIMVGPFGETFVMDWGLARVVGRDDLDRPGESGPARGVGVDTSDSWRTADGAVVGTIHYLSPEQAEGRRDRVGRATDIWALGVILYEFLTGRMPFEGRTMAEILVAIVDGRPVDPRLIDRAAPAELSAMTLKCLAAAPEERYPSAVELGRDLEAFLDGRPLSAARYGPLQLLGKWVARHRAVSAVTALALLALALMAVESYRRLDVRRREAEAARAEAEGLLALKERREAAIPLFEKASRLLEETRSAANDAGADGETLRRMAGEARVLAEAGIERSPDLAVGHFLAGLAWQIGGRTDRAEALWRRAIEVDGDFGPARLLLGRSLWARRALLEIEATWGGAPALFALQSAALTALAAPHIEHALRHPEDLDRVDRLLARTLAADLRGDVAEARRLAAGGAEDLRGRLGAEEFDLVLALRSTGPARVERLDRVLAASGAHSLALVFRAFESWRGGRGDLALLDRALEFQPRLPHAHVLRGIVLAGTGRREEADVAFARALEVSPPEWPARVEIERIRRR